MYIRITFVIEFFVYVFVFVTCIYIYMYTRCLSIRLSTLLDVNPTWALYSGTHVVLIIMAYRAQYYPAIHRLASNKGQITRSLFGPDFGGGHMAGDNWRLIGLSSGLYSYM